MICPSSLAVFDAADDAKFSSIPSVVPLGILVFPPPTEDIAFPVAALAFLYAMPFCVMACEFRFANSACEKPCWLGPAATVGESELTKSL